MFAYSYVLPDPKPAVWNINMALMMILRITDPTDTPFKPNGQRFFPAEGIKVVWFDEMVVNLWLKIEK